MVLSLIFFIFIITNYFCDLNLYFVEYKYMKLINTKNRNILANKLEIADNPFKRMKGLLGMRHLSKGKGLHIIPCNSIHSFFMKFNFDAIFINKKNMVVYMIENMPAWQVSKICFDAHSVVELPAGILQITETKVGDILEFC